MVRTNEIHVLSAVDNHYLPMLAALIKSIEANLESGYSICYWVIENDITADNRRRLEASLDPQITAVKWVDGQKLVKENLPFPLDISTYPKTIFLRYYFPYFLPSGIERIIYMDVDMINCRNLAELWNTDLAGHVVGAVQDPRIRTFDCEWGGVRNYHNLGFKASTGYLNAGLLLIDVQLWKDENITERIFKTVSKHVDVAIFPDQYGLNITIAGLWMELNPLWNFFASVTHNVTPYNIHFIDRKPIYLSYKDNPLFRQEFFRYLKKTKWDELQPISESRRYRKKIANVLPKLKTFVLIKLVSRIR